MKYIILLGDGMADHPLEELGGKTPIEAAATPAMDEVVRRGIVGLFCPIPEGMDPGSDVGNLSMFGYDPRRSFRGRAPIEAARQGIVLAPHEVAFRCNLVTLEHGKMKSFTAGHISTPEAAELITALGKALQDLPAAFYPGVQYRHLCVVAAEDEAGVDALAELKCEPPHNITDRDVAPYCPAGPGASPILEIMRRSQALLPGHPVNSARIAAGKEPANAAWLWGQGKAPSMASFADKFGLTGAVVSAVDLVKGIGVCAGLDVIDVPGATGWVDTNYEGKITAALNALEDHDFVYVHLEAPDEAAHQGRTDLKIQAIEDFDAKVVDPTLKYLDTHHDARVLVAPDHFTLISTKTHAGGPVPFAACGRGIQAGRLSSYSERSAAESGLVHEDGYALIEQFLRGAELCT